MSTSTSAFASLAGQTFLVFGASSGIGAATALALGRRGANVGVAARRLDRCEEVARAVDDAGGHGLALRADVTDEEAVAAAVHATEERFDGLQGAFNTAGSLPSPHPLTELPREVLERQLQIHVVGTFLAMKYELPALYRHGGGAIVNTGSIATQVASPTIEAYSVAKAAVVGLSRAAAASTFARGVRVNVVSPGPIVTPMSELGFGSHERLADIMRGTPAGRAGTAEEVAEVVCHLLSPGGRYVNGQELVVDGGFALT